jgi:hypothetical protein
MKKEARKPPPRGRQIDFYWVLVFRAPMAHRLGIFLGALLIGMALLIARPWIPGSGPETLGLLRVSVIGAVIIYAVVRGVGWVFSGR